MENLKCPLFQCNGFFPTRFHQPQPSVGEFLFKTVFNRLPHLHITSCHSNTFVCFSVPLNNSKRTRFIWKFNEMQRWWWMNESFIILKNGSCCFLTTFELQFKWNALKFIYLERNLIKNTKIYSFCFTFRRHIIFAYFDFVHCVL